MTGESLGIFFNSFFSLLPVIAILFYAIVSYIPTGLLIHYNPPLNEIPQHLRRIRMWGSIASYFIFIFVLFAIFSSLSQVSITDILSSLLTGLKGNPSEFGIILISIVAFPYLKIISFYLSAGVILLLLAFGCDMGGVINMTEAFNPMPHLGMSVLIILLILLAKIFPYVTIFIYGWLEDIIEKIPESASSGLNSVLIVYINFIPLGLYCSYLVSQFQ
jgi:hypothetical protein